jgi:type IV conjugative transfer system protein TraL
MSDSLDNYMIPRLLDAPNMALWVEQDTALIGASGLYVGLATGNLLHLVVATVATIIIARYYARIKTSGGRGLISQLMYWYLPGNKINQPVSPVIREYRG